MLPLESGFIADGDRAEHRDEEQAEAESHAQLVDADRAQEERDRPEDDQHGYRVRADPEARTQEPAHGFRDDAGGARVHGDAERDRERRQQDADYLVTAIVVEHRLGCGRLLARAGTGLLGRGAGGGLGMRVSS